MFICIGRNWFNLFGGDLMIYAAIAISIFLFILCLILFWVQGNINKELLKDLDHLYNVLHDLKKVGTEIHNETIRALVELEHKIKGRE